MVTEINPGFSGKITIYDPYGNKCYSQKVHSEKEVEEFKEQYGKSPTGWSFWQASLVPVRTDTLRNCAKDLLCPNLAHTSLKSQNVFGKVIHVLNSFLMDFLLFPSRLVALPFRKVYNDYVRQNSGPLKDEIPVLNLVDSAPKRVKIQIKTKNVQVKSLGPEPGLLEKLWFGTKKRWHENATVKASLYKLWIPIKVEPGNCRKEKEIVGICYPILKDGYPI